jgi:hypothetical protein
LLDGFGIGQSASQVIRKHAPETAHRREWLGPEESAGSRGAESKSTKEKAGPPSTKNSYKLSVGVYTSSNLRSAHQSCHRSLPFFYSEQESRTVEQTMSRSTDSQGWERFKNAIRALYIAEAHPLEGPNGVIKLMESRHRFRAT